MARRILTTILIGIVLSSISSNAQETKRKQPLVTYGVEWSYVASFLSSSHQNFYSPEGSRVDLKGTQAMFRSDAEVDVHVGANIGKMWNLSLHAGYTNIAHIHTAVPLSLRLTKFYGNDPMKDRWMTYVGLGGGVTIKEIPGAMLEARIGGGYRISLSRMAKLDILASFKLDYSNPDIVYYGQAIPPESINRNNSFITAFTIGLGITL